MAQKIILRYEYIFREFLHANDQSSKKHLESLMSTIYQITSSSILNHYVTYVKVRHLWLMVRVIHWLGFYQGWIQGYLPLDLPQYNICLNII